MKINLQALNKELYPIECEPTDTVAELKQKIEAERGVPPPQQNLVFGGKVLTDTSVLSAVGIKDGSKIIFFPKTRPKQPAAQPTASQPTPVPTASTTTPTTTVTTTPTTPAKQEEKPATQTTPADQQKQSEPSAPQQPQRAGLPDEAKLKELTDMGFPRDQAQQALRAADGNVQIAVEFLMGGMPEPGFGMGAPLGQTGGALGQAGGALGQATGAHPYLDELRTHPQLNHIRQIIQANPSSVLQIMQQLSQSAPMLASEIASNPQEFSRVLAGIPSDAPLPTRSGGDGDDDDGDDDGDDDSQGEGHHPAPQGAPELQLTPQDQANIEQIIAITGTSRLQAVQAYLACEKNVENAINLIFDS